MGLTAVPPFFWPCGEDDRPADRQAEALGRDGQCHLVVRAPDRCVVAVDPRGRVGQRYVNRTRANSERSVQVFAEAWTRRVSLAEGELAGPAEQLRGAPRQIDATALMDADNWWSVVIEQLRDG